LAAATDAGASATGNNRPEPPTLHNTSPPQVLRAEVPVAVGFTTLTTLFTLYGTHSLSGERGMMITSPAKGIIINIIF
jgi:hypothetical protein